MQSNEKISEYEGYRIFLRISKKYRPEEESEHQKYSTEISNPMKFAIIQFFQQFHTKY